MPKDDSQNKNDIVRAAARCWLACRRAGQRLLTEKNMDMTFEQAVVLFILRERDGSDLRTVAEHADRDRTTITRMIDGLERRSLVVRVPDQTDARRRLIYLTHQGRQQIDYFGGLKSDFDKVALRGIPAGDLRLSVRTLDRICDNLGFRD
jgi:DNA-binding MarR family transcriptional regulator